MTVLIDFKRTMRQVHNLPMRTEIHASEYINRRIFGIQKHVRLSILRNLIDEISKLDYISITNVVVDKNGKPQDYDVFNYAWLTLFQRFENTLIHSNFPGRHRTDNGIVITDATAGHKLQRLVRKMAVHNYIPHDNHIAVGSRNMPIRRIIEDPHGKDSAQTLAVQTCDVVAYFLQQRFAPNAYVRRKKANLYFDRLRPVLNRHASRFNDLGIVVL